MRSPGMSTLFYFVLLLQVFYWLPSAIHAAPLSSDPPTSNSLFLPLAHGPLPPQLLLSAAHIDSATSYEPDEAVQIWNVGGSPQSLRGWQISANTRSVSFPLTSTLVLEPGQQIWCAAEADAFYHAYGFLPSCEWDEASKSATPDLEGDLTIANAGGILRLLDKEDRVHDLLIYGDESQPVDGWSGLPAQLYNRGAIGRAGQIWYRKLDSKSDLPIDTDSATDWASDMADLTWGRRVRYPGWLPIAGPPNTEVVSATTTVAIGPEGLYEPLADALSAAQSSIDLSLYTFEHPHLTQILIDALGRGVRIRLLLEGGPAGGISGMQKWCIAQIVAAGADVLYMAPNEEAPNGYRSRYSFLHAKYGVIDGVRTFNGTENPTLDAMPLKGDGTVGGRRGFYLFTDATPVVEGMQKLFDHDWSPERFLDLHPYQADHHRYGGPPETFVMPEPEEYLIEDAPFREQRTAKGRAMYGIVSAPENALHPDGGLLYLLNQAGEGDEILAWQLYEHRHWGDVTSNPVADPNPRLEAMLNAARRGARVRLLLDDFFDDDGALRSNLATANYVHNLAALEGLDIEVRRGNPTGGGIHAKVLLVRIGDAHWSAIGSLNGGEVSHKINREVMVLTDAFSIHSRLMTVFAWDWALSE